ncbi:hypothetical protein V1478_009355 [Vespula squamosa]|uniref:Ferritin n=1 Tax=Vespula squamosa TaxID=30214 RepID=A0ABD2APE2_VESSQ
MFLLGVLCALFITVSADSCYSKVEETCKSALPANKNSLFPNCNATFGSIKELQADLQAYANAHIESSYELLLMSTQFGNYESNRDGFKALYRKLSDKTWEDAINIIKFITKRGGRMNFNQLPRYKKNGKENKILQFNEINSLAKALDIEKQLAEEALNIHSKAQHHTKQDPSIAHYVEEQFMEQQADCVRQLAGHINDLKKLLLTDHDASISVFLFDEYLKKTV